MKKSILFIATAAIVMFFSSCGSTKDVAYFQNADSVNYEASKGLYDARIMPKDLITVSVSTTDPKAAAPFNLSSSGIQLGTSSSSSGQGSQMNYLVDNDGTIKFPIVGKLSVGGLTKRQCEDMIEKKISPYLAQGENPVVTVRMASFKVSVTGEVNSPGVFVIDQEKINIVEALARAGDLTIYGKRENVLLIREDATGKKTTFRINLTDANLINSPLYYLQQNDIIVVEPNSVKAKNASVGASTTLWFSAIGIVTSLASLVINIVRN